MSEYAGFDVSKEETTFCVKDEEGRILVRGKAASDPEALFEVLRRMRLARAASFWRRARCRPGLRAACAGAACPWR